MSWIISNLGTMIVALTLASIVAAIVFRMIKNKKAGRSNCGCGCANCAMKGRCRGGRRSS